MSQSLSRRSFLKCAGSGAVSLAAALLAAHKSRTVLTQFVFDFSLRQNKGGGRFFALRSVDFFNLLGFGRDVGIEET